MTVSFETSFLSSLFGQNDIPILEILVLTIKACKCFINTCINFFYKHCYKMLSDSYLSQNISAFPLPLKIIHVHCTYLTGYRHGYQCTATFYYR